MKYPERYPRTKVEPKPRDCLPVVSTACCDFSRTSQKSRDEAGLAEKDIFNTETCGETCGEGIRRDVGEIEQGDTMIHTYDASIT